MSNLSIVARGVGKQYRFGPPERYVSLRDSLIKLVRPSRREGKKFWAVHDVSFDVAQGEVVGIIGRNGAGKSTLLKLLSRITGPTAGSIEIHGRISCLLEVGTGFHPELSGRDNIFLNGTILGMSRTDIKRQFNEIVAFAEVEQFIDTPVKHYSSGMYLRLAFAVAAHLQPEILIVDEVLAVGDARFQKKCMDKMTSVSQHGRTVLFVSHNMPAITRLCPRAILLDGGKVVADGPSHTVVTAYLRGALGTTAERIWSTNGPGNEIARLRGARVIDSTDTRCDAIEIRKAVGIEIEYEVVRDGHVLVPNIVIYNEEGIKAFHAMDPTHEAQYVPKAPGIFRSVCWLPGNFLSEGTYLVDVALSTMDPVVIHFNERDALAFQVVESIEDPYKPSARGRYAGYIPGIIRPMLDWTSERKSTR